VRSPARGARSAGHGLGVEGDAPALVGLGAIDCGDAVELLADAVPDGQDSSRQVQVLPTQCEYLTAAGTGTQVVHRLSIAIVGQARSPACSRGHLTRQRQIKSVLTATFERSSARLGG
jgi:hypothetical protein